MKNMVKKRSVPLKEKIMYGVLTATAGTLTLVAFLCVVLFYTSPGFCKDLFPVQTASVGGITDRIKVEYTAVPTGGAIGNTQSSSNKAGNGSVSGTTGSGSAVSDAGGGTAADGANGSTASSGSSAGTGTDSTVSSSSVVAGGSSGSGAGTNGSSSGTDGSSGGSGAGSTGGSAGDGSTDPQHRVKSACFGGAGHCLIGE